MLDALRSSSSANRCAEREPRERSTGVWCGALEVLSRREAAKLPFAFHPMAFGPRIFGDFRIERPLAMGGWVPCTANG